MSQVAIHVYFSIYNIKMYYSENAIFCKLIINPTVLSCHFIVTDLTIFRTSVLDRAHVPIYFILNKNHS